MKNYPFDWKIKLTLWLMSRGPAPSAAASPQFHALANESPPAFLYRRFTGVAFEDTSIPAQHGSIPIRIYRPEGAGPRALIVYYHGGGFVLGGLESHHEICRRLAAENRAIVVAVDYRLAPLNKYPAAVEDAVTALGWASAHAAELNADPARLVVMGDSAGGNLAAVVSLIARDSGGPPLALQVLIYPVVDLGGSYPSKETYDDIPILDRKALDYYRDQYIRQAADLQDGHVSPILSEQLGNLPPALILTGEYDALRDEGQAYAARLLSAGNAVTSACFPGMPHGFLSLGRMAGQTEAAFEQIKLSLSKNT